MESPGSLVRGVFNSGPSVDEEAEREAGGCRLGMAVEGAGRDDLEALGKGCGCGCGRRPDGRAGTGDSCTRRNVLVKVLVVA